MQRIMRFKHPVLHYMEDISQVDEGSTCDMSIFSFEGVKLPHIGRTKIEVSTCLLRNPQKAGLLDIKVPEISLRYLIFREGSHLVGYLAGDYPHDEARRILQSIISRIFSDIEEKIRENINSPVEGDKPKGVPSPAEDSQEQEEDSEESSPEELRLGELGSTSSSGSSAQQGAEPSSTSSGSSSESSEEDSQRSSGRGEGSEGDSTCPSSPTSMESTDSVEGSKESGDLEGSRLEGKSPTESRGSRGEGTRSLTDSESSSPSSEEDGDTSRLSRGMGEAPDSLQGQERASQDREASEGSETRGQSPLREGGEVPSPSPADSEAGVPSEKEGSIGELGEEELQNFLSQFGFSSESSLEDSEDSSSEELEPSDEEKREGSTSARSSWGGAYASWGAVKLPKKLVKRARQSLSRLLLDSGEGELSPRYDYVKVASRLAGYLRPFETARKEESGTPHILLLVDVSASMSAFAREVVALAKAVAEVGLDKVVTVIQSNGRPIEWGVGRRWIGEANLSDATDDGIIEWYRHVIRRYDVTALIIAADWDGEYIYSQLADIPSIEAVVWLDVYASNYTTPRRDNFPPRWIKDHHWFSYNNQWWSWEAIRKVKYVYGCRTAVDFCKGLELAYKGGVG